MILLQCFIPIIPRTKGRPRFAKSGRIYTPHETRVHESDLRMLMRLHYRGKPFEGPVRLVVQVFVAPETRETKHGDIDNYLKTIMDAGNKILWKDDKQIIDAKVERHFCDKIKKEPGYHILAVGEGYAKDEGVKK